MRLAAALLLSAAALGLAPAAAAADGPPVVARAAVDRDAMTIGDQALLLVTVDLARGYDLLEPGVPRAVGDFEVVEALTALQSRMPDGATRIELRYLITAWTLGPKRLPVIVVGYRAPDGTTGDSSTQGELAVTVRSVVAAGEDASDIRPLKPPLPVPEAATDALARAAEVAGIVALAVAAVVLLLRSRRRRPAAVPVAGRGAARETLAELERVLDLRLPEQGRARDHYDLVSTALRRFVAARYGVAADARTARELRRDLEAAGVGASAARVLCALLGEAEAVRYEGRVLSAAQTKRSLTDALDVVRKSVVTEEYELLTGSTA